MQALALTWRLQGGKNKPWQALQAALIRSAILYSSRINDELSDDDRLGDFGLLATKIIEKKV